MGAIAALCSSPGYLIMVRAAQAERSDSLTPKGLRRAQETAKGEGAQRKYRDVCWNKDER